MTQTTHQKARFNLKIRNAKTGRVFFQDEDRMPTLIKDGDGQVQKIVLTFRDNCKLVSLTLPANTEFKDMTWITGELSFVSGKAYSDARMEVVTLPGGVTSLQGYVNC